MSVVPSLPGQWGEMQEQVCPHQTCDPHQSAGPRPQLSRDSELSGLGAGWRHLVVRLPLGWLSAAVPSGPQTSGPTGVEPGATALPSSGSPGSAGTTALGDSNSEQEGDHIRVKGAPCLGAAVWGQLHAWVGLCLGSAGLLAVPLVAPAMSLPPQGLSPGGQAWYPRALGRLGVQCPL